MTEFKWLPIETAPKALHKPILLAIVFAEENGGGAEVGEGYWDDGYEGSSDQPPCDPGWCIPSLGFFNKLTPTHWMPLPLAPGAEVNFSNEAVSDAVQLNQTSLLSSSDTEVGDK